MEANINRKLNCILKIIVAVFQLDGFRSLHCVLAPQMVGQNCKHSLAHLI